MMEAKTVKRGRPLIGNEKRARTSITLSPSKLQWVSRKASLIGKSKSEFFEMLIDREVQREVTNTNIINFPRIYIPELKVREFCKKNNIKALYLFGSALRDDFNSSSDIDILVEFFPDKSPSYFQMIEMEGKLSTVFGNRKVDLKTIHELSRYFRDQVEKEASLLYAA